MRVFLDANVLFSAAASSGNVRVLIGLLLAREHECWVDAYVVNEARRNLARKQPASLAALDELTESLPEGFRAVGAAKEAQQVVISVGQQGVILQPAHRAGGWRRKMPRPKGPR